MRTLRDFKDNKQGIVLVSLIVIVFITVSSIIGIVGALAVNKIADDVVAMNIPGFSNSIQALNLVQTARNAYIVAIVLVDILLLIYLFVSAQRKETQDSPTQGVYF